MPSIDPDKKRAQRKAYRDRIRADRKARIAAGLEAPTGRSKALIAHWEKRKASQVDEPQTYYRIRIIQTGVAGRALHITPAQSSPELAAMALMREGLGHYKAFRGTQLWLDKGEVVRDGQGHIIIDWIRQERLGEPK